MWSVGVILYVLLCGYPPFANENQSILFEKIRIGEYDNTFQGVAWEGVSEEAKDVIRHLLVVDPLRRWTAKQALKSDWLRRDDASIAKIDLTHNVETMKKRRKSAADSLKSAARAIIWMNALSDSQRGELSNVEKVISRPEHPDVSVPNLL